MPAAAPANDSAPFAALPGETNLDATTPLDGFVTVVVTVELTGSTAQVAADYATLAAVSTLTSPSAIIEWSQG